MRFLIFDLNNLVRRTQHGKGVHGVEKEHFAGMVLHMSLDTMRYLYQWFGGGHLVICVDAGSWRYDVLPNYKAHREYDENDEIVKGVIADLAEYLQTYTNATVLKVPKAEADDCIGRWVRLHRESPFDNVIISGDGDFKQLVSSNTDVYSPNNHRLYTTMGVMEQIARLPDINDVTSTRYDREWKVLLDDQGEPVRFDPEYDLFLKCIRGDTSDNIRSAYPKVRETKLKAAFADRGGLLWNNLINSTWGENGQNSVRQQYELNKSLIDLTQIPEPILEQIDRTIGAEITKSKRSMIPVHFGKYCQRHQLTRMLDQINSFIPMFSLRYPLETVDGIQGQSDAQGQGIDESRGVRSVNSACA